MELKAGERYGRLTVVKKSSSKIGYYLLSCDCGKETEVDYKSLIYNRTLSCGCLQRERVSEVAKKIRGIKEDELVGKKYNRWTVIEVDGKDIHGQWLYHCKCECGKEKAIHRNSLLTGKSKSCGCLNSELTTERLKNKHKNDESWKELIGQKFKRLTVVRRTEEKIDNRYYYVCKCDCGNEVTVAKSNLTSGRSKSCGCLNSEVMKEKHQFKRDEFNYRSIIGNRYNRLVVTNYLGYFKGYGHRFKCKCDCGNITTVNFENLKREDTGTKSCGCLSTENSIRQLENINKQIRREKGFNENEFISETINLIRSKLFEPIKYLIFEADNYTCNLCFSTNKNELNIHHINPISKFLNIKQLDSFENIYKINNLICLCKDCHLKAHRYNTKDVDMDIQKDLQVIASMRFINQDILNEYNKIIKLEVIPWLSSNFDKL